MEAAARVVDGLAPPVEAVAELLRLAELAASRGCFSIGEFEHVGRAWSTTAAWLRAWAEEAERAAAALQAPSARAPPP